MSKKSATRQQQQPAPAGQKREQTGGGQRGRPEKRGRPASSEFNPAANSENLAHQQPQQQQQVGAGEAGAGQRAPTGGEPTDGSGGGRAKANICAACQKPIKERYLLEALDKQWHEDCLKCDGCDCRLGEVGSSLFTCSNKIFCRRDFLRIFGQKGHCAACTKPIPPYELVMRANQNAYHMDCFACQQCQYRFCVGDRFHLTDRHRVVCVVCHNEQQQQQLSQEPASQCQNQAQGQQPDRSSSSSEMILGEAGEQDEGQPQRPEQFATGAPEVGPIEVAPKQPAQCAGM